MSVCLNDFKETGLLGEQVKEFYSQTVSNFRGLKVYYKTEKFFKITGKGLTNSSINEEIIDRTFWYMFVSNQIAYSLQYQQETNLFGGEEKITYEPISPRTLLRRLRNLHYNIYTNDGNRFVEPDYYEAFRSIINNLRDYIIKEGD